MDYQAFVDGFELTTCIISIERFSDGSYGNIRIVAGNKAYIDSIENPYNGAASHMLNNKFIPGSPYERYIPKDLNFEQTCRRCAFEKRPVHTYLKPDRFDCWINQYIMPVASDDPNIGYCSYTLDVTMEADPRIMKGVSASAASSVLETCIRLRSGDFESTMNDIVADICELCDASRCSLLLTDMHEGTCTLVAQSDRKGITETGIGEDFFDIVKTWEDTIAGSNCLIIQSPQDMGILKMRNPVWQRSLEESGVDTLVLFPLRHNNDLLGYIWAVNFDPSKAQTIKETLELTTYFLASEIANHQLIKRMAVLSSIDLLTGIYNRNAMNTRVDSYIAGTLPLPQRYAVIFADLNGLKAVNDIDGHVAGDNLLKGAAQKLREVFPDCDIYRAGGDEFMLIAEDVPESSLNERVERLRKDSEDEKNISFAVGIFYEGSGGDIRTAMRTADERMYADKQEYYARFPERRRK